jgi:hypothetical protein
MSIPEKFQSDYNELTGSAEMVLKGTLRGEIDKNASKGVLKLTNEFLRSSFPKRLCLAAQFHKRLDAPPYIKPYYSPRDG